MSQICRQPDPIATAFQMMRPGTPLAPAVSVVRLWRPFLRLIVCPSCKVRDGAEMHAAGTGQPIVTAERAPPLQPTETTATFARRERDREMHVGHFASVPIADLPDRYPIPARRPRPFHLDL
jgi:hypothetical protein